MRIGEKHYHTIWCKEPGKIEIIDQRFLPHQFRIEALSTVEQVATAIREMHVRGAPLIGITAAYGMYLAVRKAQNEGEIIKASQLLKSTRPTAVNLAWAVDQIIALIQNDENTSEQSILEFCERLKSESIERCRRIGHAGLPLIQALHQENQRPIRILTHCNAGWLACIDYGTATAPIYAAHHAGIPVEVWVDETRPRNQGARLTAYELLNENIPHTIIADNTGGHLMQHGLVDIVLVGTDRTTKTGDVCNKIGTYLKALAAYDNNIPFYVGAPTSSIDWDLEDGLAEIPIEKRNSEEVSYIQGVHQNSVINIQITPNGSPVENYAFDVTPSRLVSGLITEYGIFEANQESLHNLYNMKFNS